MVVGGVYCGLQPERIVWKKHGKTHHWSGIDDTCRVCELGAKESVEHVVLECSRYEEETACLMENIENITGMKVEEIWRWTEKTKYVLYWAFRK